MLDKPWLRASHSDSEFPLRRAGDASRYVAPIDGLRAVAVLAIVLFHFRVPPFSGGYVGVDVFFVISGYLITRNVADDLDAGRFSMARFYKRRVLRLYPALYAMLAATILGALALLFPSELRRFGESLAGVGVLGSNFVFRNSFGYFNTAADQKPLLHTWSLSVEEQFYLVYPLLFAGLTRLFPQGRVAVLSAVFVGSLGWSLWAVRHAPNSAFYLLPPRFWELLMGGLLALAPLDRFRSRFLGEAAGWGGLALVAASVFSYTLDTPFPGSAALLPCCGAAMVISACPGARANGAARLLSLRPALFLGRISYSLYLWHWPVMVFAGYWLLERPGAGTSAVLVALSLALAILSWLVIETPFRRRYRTAREGAVFGAAALLMTAAVILGGAMSLTKGMPWRFSPEILAILDAHQAAARAMPARFGCLDDEQVSPNASTGCHLGATISDTPDFVVWGDSLAGNLAPAVAAAAVDKGRSGVFANRHACAPLLGVDVRRDPACRAFNDDMLRFVLARPSIRTIVLSSFWAESAVGTPQRLSGRPENLIGDDETPATSLSGNPAVFARGLHRLVEALTKAGREVVLMGSVPEVGIDVPEALARAAAGGPARDIRPVLDVVRARQAVVAGAFAGVRDAFGATVVDPDDTLCKDGRCAVSDETGAPLYFDAAHLNWYGARKLVPLLQGVM